MHNATVHSAECFLINLAPRNDRAAWHVAAAQRLCESDNVRLQIPMLEAEHFTGAAKSGLHFIRDQQCPIFTAKLLRANKEIGLRRFAAFALDRLNDKSRNVPRG